jgi:hypothetical protein
MTDKERAVELLLLTMSNADGGERYWRDQCVRLAMQWPSLAAALADLTAAYEMPTPPPFRAAASVLRGELPGMSEVSRCVPVGWCYCERLPYKHKAEETSNAAPHKEQEPDPQEDWRGRYGF